MSETVAPDLLDEVRRAWAQALDIEIESVPLEVSFLDAGGNSLLLLLLWEDLNEMTDRELRAADLFEHNTVRAQVALLSGDGERGLAVLGASDRGRLLGRARRAQTAQPEDRS